jgi:hypothetical protein
MTRVVKNPSGYTSKGRTAAEKADNFGQYAKQHGWSGKWTGTEEPHTVHLFCRRGESETIDIWWHSNGSLMLDRLPVYSLAGERIKLRNVSAAAKIVAGQPDTSRLRKAVRKQRRQLGVVETPEEAAELLASVQGSLPFDHESTDAEIKAVLLGKGITWINRISGQLNSAVVGGAKHFAVKNGDCPRQIQFIDDYGFHSVYLDSIVSVG